MRKMIAVLVSDSPGVLARVAGLFARRGYNIDSLAVGAADRLATSRMTIAFEGDEAVMEQVTKQLNKLIDVYKVVDLDPDRAVARELALVRVHCEPPRRPQVVQLADLFRAHVVDVTRDSVIVEVSGTQDKVEALIHLLRDYGLQELVRTGPIALERGTDARQAGEVSPLARALREDPARPRAPASRAAASPRARPANVSQEGARREWPTCSTTRMLT